MAKSKQHGPTTITEEICANCDYLNFGMGMCDCWADCKHPDVGVGKFAGQDRRSIGKWQRGADGGVPTPKWCPMRKAGKPRKAK